ncbi:MAG: hypothetical protein U0840_22990 [Gemmataceae bacterium]
MKHLLGLIGCLALAGPLLAGEPKFPWWEYLCPVRIRLDRCCPDDYCRKSQPDLPAPFCPCGPDDYCRKPLPGLPPEFKPCGCDDYDRKQPPEIACSPAYMKCYPTDGAPQPKCPWWSFPWWGPRMCRP